MGHRLYREVLEHAPADLSWAELGVWLILADDANDDTRTGWLDQERLYRRARHRKTAVREALAKLTARGYELRVVRSWDRHGRPQYTHRGAKTTYVMPRLAPVDNSQMAPDSAAALAEKGAGQSDRMAPDSPTEWRRTVRPPSPQHLRSPQQQDGPVAIVTRHTDATDVEAAAVLELIRREKRPDNLAGLVVTLARAGELVDWLARARAEKVATDASASAAERARAGPQCEHLVPGGADPVAPQCALCRNAGMANWWDN